MDPIELKKMLDKAERMGYERGVKTVVFEILKAMEDKDKTFITYEEIKFFYESIDARIKKINKEI